MERTANARKTPAIVLPAVFTVEAMKYHRKLAWRSGARLPENDDTPRA